MRTTCSKTVVTAFGMTECVVGTMCRRGDPPELVAGTCGRVVPGLELRVSRPGTNDDGINGVRTQTAAPLEADNGSGAAVAQALLPSTVQIVAQLDGREEGAR